MSKKPTITNWASINKASGVAMSNRHMPSRAIWLRISSRGEPIAMRNPISPRRIRTRYQNVPITQSRIFKPKKAINTIRTR